MTEVKITLTDKTQVIGMTALLAAGLTVLSLWWLVPELRIKTSPEDIPIAMAGGSFHMHPGRSDTWTKTNSKLEHSRGLRVWAIDLVEPSGLPTHINTFGWSGNHKIKFTYCKDLANCSANDRDDIELRFNASSANKIVIASDAKNKLDYATPTPDDPTHKGLDHPDTTWVLKTVELPGKNPVECGSLGRCTVIVHTCVSTTPYCP